MSRYHWPGEGELAVDVPGWTARVEERNKAFMRPLDGYPAYLLKDRVCSVGYVVPTCTILSSSEGES